ncbi:MAG: divergent polysaccharide deacetylase family protein [Alphaproteobacteria bacterium]
MGTRFRRHARLFYGVAAVFAAGVVVGAVLGGWVARDDAPGADVAIDRVRPALEVPVRAYRPPVRVAEPRQPVPGTREQQPEPQSLQPPDTAAAPPDMVTAEPELPAKRPVEPPVAVAPADPPEPVTRLDTPGTATWLANAVASPATEGRPMIAIVIDDLGIDQARTKRAIALPAPLTLAFIPYGYNLRILAKSGRQAGHELIVHVNMEPTDRGVDPGPKALLTSLSQAEIRERVNWALGRFDGYVGINNHMGSRFTEWPDGMETVLQILRVRGLLFLDSLTSTSSVGAPLARAYGMAYAARDVFLDHDQSAESVIARLKETERIARRNGSAIAIGHPHDVTVDALRKWIPQAKAAGFQLVPLTAIVRSRRGEG